MTLTEESPIPDPSILEHAGDSISESLIRTLPGHAYDVLHSSMAECHWIVGSGVMLTLEVVVVQQAKRLHERSVRFTSCAPARCPDER